MRRRVLSILCAALAAAVVLPAAGCRSRKSLAKTPPTASATPSIRAEKGFRKKASGAASPEQEAVFAILEGDKDQFRQMMDDLRSDSQPSAVAHGLQKYQEHLTKTDLGPCPTEFRAAYARYQKAVKQLQAGVARLPDHFEDTAFMDAFVGLSRGQTERGKKLGGDVSKAAKEMNSTLAQVYASAEGYGIEVDH